MKPKTIKIDQGDLFRNRLENLLNPKHELLQLSKMIPWVELEEEFSDIFGDSNLGRPGSPIRLMIGLLLLQHMHNLSDEAAVRNWVENPYWQHFCGYDFLQWNLPIDPSSMSRWRKYIGPERLGTLLSMSVSVAVKSGVVEKRDLENVIVDTTVMEKNIEYPTDTKLLEKARIKMVKLANKEGMTLRQNYNFVAKKLLRKIGGYLHGRQFKRAKKAIRHFKVIVGRVARDCERGIASNHALEPVFSKILEQTNHLLTRKMRDKNKLYSLHEPDVVCISKGKAHKKYEFGCKVSLAVTHKKGRGIITGAEALAGNPYDGHTLKDALEFSSLTSGVKVKKAFVDKGYKGHSVSDCNVFISGAKRGVTRSLKAQMKRRQAIEPHIGHLKNEGKLGLCRLKGVIGDQINVLLVAASYNLKQVLAHLRVLLIQIFGVIFFASLA